MRVLIGKLLAIDVVALRYGFNYITRFVRQDADGNNYVRAYGDIEKESGQWIWLHRIRADSPTTGEK